MKEKENLEGSLESFPLNQIYLNINHLKDGEYMLKIVHKDKVVKQVRFKKNELMLTFFYW